MSSSVRPTPKAAHPPKGVRFAASPPKRSARKSSLNPDAPVFVPASARTPSSSLLVQSGDSHTVRVTEENFMALKRFVPSADVGGCMWVAVDSTAEGRVVKASVHLAAARGEAAEAQPLDPRSAARIVKEVPGFECAALRHLDVGLTDAAYPSAKPTSAPAAPAAADALAGATEGVAALDVSDARDAESQRTPVRQANDQFVLARLEEFIESAAFRAVVRSFASEHAHKFKPVTAEEEHPLHYHALYLQYEALLEAALAAFLAATGQSVNDLVGCVRRAQARNEPLACVDLLLATSDYLAFIELMLDYKFDLIAEREETPDSVVSAALGGEAAAAGEAGGAARSGAARQ